MGTLESKKYSSTNEIKLQLNIEIGKDILPQFMILTNWSFQQIRSTYQLFTRYSAECPFIDAFIFHKIMPFSGNISRQIFFLFSNMGKKYVPVYELICILVLLSFSTHKRKLQFLYLLFDFNHEQQLKMKHFVLIYESLYIGYLKVTGQNVPSHSYIKKYLYEYYLKSETLQVLQRSIQYRKFIQQVEGSFKINKLFGLFSQNFIQQKRQNPNTFSLAGLKKYDKLESAKIFRIVKKVYEQKNYQQVQMVQKNKRFRLENRKTNCLKNTEAQIQKKFESTSNFRIKNRSYSMKNFSNNKANKIVYNGQIQQNKNQKQSSCYHKNPNFRESQFDNSAKLALQSKIGFQVNSSSLFSTMSGRKKLRSQFTKDTGQNKRPMIFLNGKTHSKKQIFQVIDYFNSLSNNKQQIKIKQFFKMFDKKSFLKKQLNSFFRFFDANKNGIVTFQEFIRAYYPGIQAKSIKKIFQFNEEYRQIYNADTAYNNKIDQKKNVIELPEQTKQRISQIFNSLDLSKNGYLSFQDIKASYTQLSTKQLQNLMKDHGQDGKIYIDGLCRMLLPEGWSIQGCNWHIKKKR